MVASSLECTRLFSFLLTLIMVVCEVSLAQAPISRESATLVDGLGSYGRKISTDSQLAQQYFDQGLRLTYGYYFPEAIASFQQAQQHDAEHPMIYWGLALALGPNPNSRFVGFRDDPHGEGRKAITAARGRLAKASPVERALIDALYVRFDVETYPDRSERDVKYIEAIRRVVNSYPDDLEACFLHADAIMTHSQWSYWRRDGSPLPRTRDAAAALEHVMALEPKHPGAVHLYIHLFESSTRPERAMPQADLLESLMPKAGHVVHMPSHIYVRLGQYEKAIASNERSLVADQVLLSEWGERSLPSVGTYGMSHRTHGRHAWDFMRYASMLQGNYERTLKAAKAAASGQTHMGMGAAGRLQATVFLIHKVFGKWDAVLAEPAPAHGSPYLDGLWRYVRGSAFVRRGEFDKAEIELQKLKAAESDPTIKDLLAVANPARRVLQLATHGLEGEIALARRRFAAAVTSFEAAVRLQDTLLYIEPPDWGQSMRLYLGHALLKARRPREAEKVYREDLSEFRENGWALFGLWQSLRDQGKNKEARRVRARFDQAWKGADVTLRASIF
jgi:tetratricopeptide (TPR) repeat protein